MQMYLEPSEVKTHYFLDVFLFLFYSLPYYYGYEIFNMDKCNLNKYRMMHLENSLKSLNGESLTP